MKKFDQLISNILTAHLKEKHYEIIWDMISEDQAIFQALIDVASESEMISFLSYLEYQASESGGAFLDEQLDSFCNILLPRCYKEGKYELCAYIYTVNYGPYPDPLCGCLNPLLFAARENNIAFAEAYIRKLQEEDSTPFDDERLGDDGIYHTLLEELVLEGSGEFFDVCLKYGANPNAFTCRGDRLLDIAKEPIASRLREHGAKSATQEERLLLRTYYELHTDRVTQETLDALAATPPLMHLQWYNDIHGKVFLHQVDLIHDVARNCNSRLLSILYPYVSFGNDNKQLKDLLFDVLDSVPFGDIIDERPEDIAASYEALEQAGLRYPVAGDADQEHSIFTVIHFAASSLSIGFAPPAAEIQHRVFRALWKIGNCTTDKASIAALQKIAKEYPSLEIPGFIESLS